MIDQFSSPPEHRAGAILTIDLAAIRANYRLLCERLGGVACGGVVKANAYGLGVYKVAPALYEEGCRDFFVAHIEEAITLRGILPQGVEIHVLNGLFSGVEGDLRKYSLLPVLNTLEQVDKWKTFCGDNPLPCDLHVDTGMLRLGLEPAELDEIQHNPSLLSGMDIRNVISHLASAEDLDTEQSARQLDAFHKVRRIIPNGKASFANSSGIFLGSDYHFDLARPGVALYGVSPNRENLLTMNPVCTLRARIVQVRDASAGETVGYGATHAVFTPTRVATLPVGYADGYLRSLSSAGFGFIGEFKVPVIGRVSMDLITIDVTQVPDALCQPGNWVDLIGPRNSVDDIATAGATIGYEILTSLGNRYHRVYTSQ